MTIQNHIFVDKNVPEAFVLISCGICGKVKCVTAPHVNHTFYLSDRGFDDPNVRIALVYINDGITTIELDDGESHIGLLGTWSVDNKTTHKFTCLDGLSPVFGRAVTRKAVKR